MEQLWAKQINARNSKLRHSDTVLKFKNHLNKSYLTLLRCHRKLSILNLNESKLIVTVAQTLFIERVGRGTEVRRTAIPHGLLSR